jgi:hypothetical protein
MSVKLNKKKDHSNFWKTINYDNLNELPDYPGDPDDPDVDMSTMPHFFNFVIDEPLITNSSIAKFFLYYYHSSEFRNKVQSYTIMLLNHQYAGVFKDKSEGLKYADKLNVKGQDILFIPIATVFE